MKHKKIENCNIQINKDISPVLHCHPSSTNKTDSWSDTSSTNNLEPVAVHRSSWAQTRENSHCLLSLHIGSAFSCGNIAPGLPWSFMNTSFVIGLKEKVWEALSTKQA